MNICVAFTYFTLVNNAAMKVCVNISSISVFVLLDTHVAIIYLIFVGPPYCFT